MLHTHFFHNISILAASKEYLIFHKHLTLWHTDLASKLTFSVVANVLFVQFC